VESNEVMKVVGSVATLDELLTMLTTEQSWHRNQPELQVSSTQVLFVSLFIGLEGHGFHPRGLSFYPIILKSSYNRVEMVIFGSV
jgi:hypothetical protein